MGAWGPGALLLLGYKVGVPRVLLVHSLLIIKFKTSVGIRAWEGKSVVSGMVSYLGFPGLSIRRSSWVPAASFLI